MWGLTDGQLLAAKTFGMAPVAWGWVIAAAFIMVAIHVWRTDSSGWFAPRSSEGLSKDDHRKVLWVVVGLGLLLHSYGFLGHFNMFDDGRQILADKQIHTLSWENFWYYLTQNHKGTAQEWMYLSFMFNWALAKKAYWVWYLFNWVLLVPMMLCVDWIGRSLTDNRTVGPLAAGFFATSPIVAELLCWMSARSHLYGLTLMLLASGAYLAYVRSEDRSRWRLLALSVVAFLASQAGKPIFIFLPAWLILFDVYLGRRNWKLAVVDKLPFVAVAIASYVRVAVYGVGPGLIKKSPLGGSYFNTILQDFNILVEYGRTLFIPSELGILPPFNEADGLFAVVGEPMVMVNGFAPLASLLILLSVGAMAVAARVRHGDSLPLTWLLLAGVSVATVMNIPNRGHAATFEYRYTLSANVVPAVLLADLAVRFCRGRLAGIHIQRHIPMVLVTALLVVGAVMTAKNTHAWQISHHLWERNARMYPNSYFARYYAGKSCQWDKRYFDAVEHLLVADKFNVDNRMELHKRLADNAHRIQRFDIAKEHWAVYFKRFPKKVDDKYKEKLLEVGLVFDRLGRVQIPAEEAPAEDQKPVE